MRYRSRDKIIEDVLAEARKGKTKTSIMHKCSLSGLQIVKYLEALVGAGFLYEEENPYYGKKGKDKRPVFQLEGLCGDTSEKKDRQIKAIYTTTEDGWHYLNALEKSRVGTEKVKEFF